MPTKKKTTKKPAKKPAKSKRAVVRKKTSSKAKAKGPDLKKLTKKKRATKKVAAKQVVSGKKLIRGKKTVAAKRSTPVKKQRRDEAVFTRKTVDTRSGEQSGDFQGMRNVEGADSESVDELLEEGNAFEAEAVSGVEDADDHEEREVRTHEVPEDDVPGEYLDKDE